MSTDTTPQTPAEFVATMLRSSVEADLLMAEYINDTPLRQAEQQAAVNGFVAGVAMENLHRFAPGPAEALAQHLDHVLTAGDLGGPAYRAAKKLGHDPDAWLAEFDERAARREEKANAAPTWDGPDVERDPHDITQDVVAKFIADNLTCGIPAATVLARSLQTELDVAGVSVDDLVNSELDNQAGEQRAAGA